MFAHTRHATSRAGDPAPHDHVLVANLVEMRDERGGWKAADTTVWREHLHAATVTGRVAGARRAVELGYRIEADDGPSGRLGHWRIAGVPVEVEEVFSKRAAEVTAAVAERGVDSYRARQVAARTTRSAKRYTPVGDLMGRWQAELAGIGLTPEALVRDVDAGGPGRPGFTPGVAPGVVPRRAAAACATRCSPPTAVSPPQGVRPPGRGRRGRSPVFGRDPTELVRAVDVLFWDPEVVPLLGVGGARERVYAPASVIAVEAAIATDVPQRRRGHAAPPPSRTRRRRSSHARRAKLGGPLTDGQADAVRAIATSGRRVELVVGVAGAGKTTALAVSATPTESSRLPGDRGVDVGQAARTLGREAGSRAARSRRCCGASTTAAKPSTPTRGDRRRGRHDRRPRPPRVLVAAEAAGAKVVLVGDHRQLGPVGPGGTFGGLLDRAHGAVHVLDENVRQHDPGERCALEDLRAGDVDRAVAWYTRNERITVASTRDDALNAMVDAWIADTCSGLNSGLYAWRARQRRRPQHRARTAWAADGHLNGPELEAPGGRR